MNLSKLTLNPRSRQVQFDLSNPYEAHRTLMSAFPAQLAYQERILYRLETSHQPPYLLILLQSHLTPDWSALEQKDYLLQPVEVKSFEPLFQAGQMLAFRLAANPVKRLKSTLPDKFGKRVRLYQPEKQQDWLLRKAQQNGFSVINVQVTNLSDQLAYKKDGTGKRMKITHFGVRFDGLLRVEDPERLKIGLSSGIGSAKGFGFGLLSLARI